MKMSSYQFTDESLENIDKSLQRIADCLEELCEKLNQ